MQEAAENRGRAPAAAYAAELWAQKRLLLAALLGLGVGSGFTSYVYSIMGPHFIQDLGWSRAEFATTNALVLIVVVLYPFFGRLNDLLGVRRTALIGVITMPATYAAFSVMNGDFKVYLAILLVQVTLSITTSAVVYTRVVVHYFNRARGLALGIVASGPALLGAFGAPVLNAYVEMHGWRSGFVAVAIVTALLGAAALLLLPAQKKSEEPQALTRMQNTKQDYKTIFSTRAFWILLLALFLCNFPNVLQLSQISLLLLENGVATADASLMLSALAIGTLVGRFLCGAALDRFPAQIVATIAMGLPTIGLVLFASSLDSPVILTLAVLLIGLSFGAEGDLIGYIVSRTFGTRIYSSVFGFMTATVSIGSAGGAIALSYLLAVTGNYTLFLLICAVLVFAGSLLFLTLKPLQTRETPDTALQSQNA